MLIALTRTPSPHLDRCHLTHIPRSPIDPGKAREQHREYEFLLRGLQVQVLRLPETPDLPDGVFVQDTALVCDELAISAPLFLPSRQDEAVSTMMALAWYREVIPFMAPATFDGGDVIIAGRDVFVGLTGRTNRAAFEQIRDVMQTELGEYRVRAVRVDGCVHLKTGCAYLGRRTFVLNQRWVDVSAFAGYECIPVPEEEPFGANTLTVQDTIIVSASCPRTAAAIAQVGFSVLPVDISEFEKAEAGVSCLSLLFSGIPSLIAEPLSMSPP
jgi:dimethylargininase